MTVCACMKCSLVKFGKFLMRLVKRVNGFLQSTQTQKSMLFQFTASTEPYCINMHHCITVTVTNLSSRGGDRVAFKSQLCYYSGTDVDRLTGS